MSADQILNDIHKSLDPSALPPEPQRKPKDASTVDVAQALLKLPKLVAALEAFVDAKKGEVDLLNTFTQIDFDVKMLVSKADANLQQTSELKKYMVQRLKALDSMEAEWNLLKQRVSNILDELERVLKQI